ncbi:MAG: hypothetical protein U0790_00805 [Isosphaeraceae bacterium]
MMTADAYFGSTRPEACTPACSMPERNELIGRITWLSGDLVPRIEIDRAKNLVADLEQRATSSRQDWGSQAPIHQVLRLDRAVVVPLEPDHLQVTLIDPARPLDDLILIALTNRPELAANQAFVRASIERIPARRPVR